MMWIRSPAWDLCCIWSAIPIGLSVAFMSPGQRLWFFAVALMAETAHRLSPIVLAWVHKDFRRLEVLPNLGWYVGVPLIVMVVAPLACALTPSLLTKVYIISNAVHFGL